MFCLKCGKEITNNAAFCTYCGCPVNYEEPAPAGVPLPVPPVMSGEAKPVPASAEYQLLQPEQPVQPVQPAPLGAPSPLPEAAEPIFGEPTANVQPISEAVKPSERMYTFGHLALCLAAVGLMAIVAGVFAGLYFSVV